MHKITALTLTLGLVATAGLAAGHGGVSPGALRAGGGAIEPEARGAAGMAAHDLDLGIARGAEVGERDSHRPRPAATAVGFVTALDEKNHTVMVKIPHRGELQLDVVHSTVLLDDGRRVHFGALKAGDQIRVVYTKFGPKLVVDDLTVTTTARHHH